MITEESNNKGRPNTCKYCGHQYHVQNRAQWEEEKHPCPECGEIWSDKPETERMLMILQDEFFAKNRSQKVLSQMVEIMYSYCASIIKKNFSNMIQEPGKLENYVQWAVSRLTEEYLKRPDFKVNGSFKGMLFPKIQEAIWGKQEHAAADETIDFEFDDGHKVSYSDDKKSVVESIQDYHSKEQLVNNICDLIFGISEYCTEEEDYIRMINVRNYILGGEQYTDKFFSLYGRVGKEKFLDTLNILKQELERLEKEHN